MHFIGNPPYSGISLNKGEWITRLIEDYKYVEGQHFGERKHWLQDDYVKFIRLSESLIEKNGEGILGFITNHGYLDNPTFRGMRWHLMQSFDRIFVLDLHGNAKKKEVTPDGKPDKNVFDIQQGVAIILAVKRKDGGLGLAEVVRGDLWGARDKKYQALSEGSIATQMTEKIEAVAPHYAFVNRDQRLAERYERGFSVTDLMPVNSVGIVTARDRLTIDVDKDQLWNRIQDFSALDPELARQKYALGKDVTSWRVDWAQEDIRQELSADKLTPINYRPFDKRWTYYTGTSSGFMCRPLKKVMRHMLAGENLGLTLGRQGQVVGSMQWNLVFANDSPIDLNLFYRGGGLLLPLYLYPDAQDLDQSRRVNFDPRLYAELQKRAHHPEQGVPDEIAVFDYIYAVLHCPAYRETYAEFLKADFPRIPWPRSPDAFWTLAAKGSELRQLHLMEPAAIGETPFPFMGKGEGEGDNRVEKPRYHKGKVWINPYQYFDAAPEVAWEFYIGGYQPAQKWLKDRKGQRLSYGAVRHYQAILKILAETDRIMRSITLNLEEDTA